jgi:hypothetical protein
MGTKRTVVEIEHDEGYGDQLLYHINVAMRGKDMLAVGVVQHAEVKAKADRLEATLGCVVKNCVHIDDMRERDEPGPMCGPTWAKVAHVCGLGSSSAVDLCYKYDVDPHFDCGKSR